MNFTRATVNVSLFLFAVIAAGILGAGLVTYQNSKNNLAVGSTGPTGGNPAQQALLASSGGSITLSMAEVAKHNNANSCWMVISGKVYDVTQTIGAHPGGAGTILQSCGTDATTAFATKNIGRNHSGYAYSSLSNYLLGNLNQTLTAQSLQQAQQQVQTNGAAAAQQLGGRGGDD